MFSFVSNGHITHHIDLTSWHLHLSAGRAGARQQLRGPCKGQPQMTTSLLLANSPGGTRDEQLSSGRWNRSVSRKWIQSGVQRDTKWNFKHLLSPLFLRNPIFHPLEEPSDFSPFPLPPLAGWNILTGVNGGLKPKDETLIAALQPSTPELGTVYGGWQIFPNGAGITPSRNRHNS